MYEAIWTTFAFFKNEELAREVLEYALSKTNDTINLIYLHWELVFLFIDISNFSAAYEHFLKYEELIEFYPCLCNKNTDLLRRFLKQQLGIYTPYARRNDYEYFERQITSYQERDLFSYEKSLGYTFSRGMYLLHKDLQNVLTQSVKTPNYSFFDTYWFYCPNVSLEKGRSYSYLKVMVLPSKENSYSIVKFAPYKEHKAKLYVNDFESLKEENDRIRNRTKI